MINTLYYEYNKKIYDPINTLCTKRQYNELIPEIEKNISSSNGLSAIDLAIDECIFIKQNKDNDLQDPKAVIKLQDLKKEIKQILINSFQNALNDNVKKINKYQKILYDAQVRNSKKEFDNLGKDELNHKDQKDKLKIEMAQLKDTHNALKDTIKNNFNKFKKFITDGAHKLSIGDLTILNHEFINNNKLFEVFDYTKKNLNSESMIAVLNKYYPKNLTIDEQEKIIDKEIGNFTSHFYHIIQKILNTIDEHGSISLISIISREHKVIMPLVQDIANISTMHYDLQIYTKKIIHELSKNQKQIDILSLQLEKSKNYSKDEKQEIETCLTNLKDAMGMLVKLYESHKSDMSLSKDNNLKKEFKNKFSLTLERLKNAKAAANEYTNKVFSSSNKTIISFFRAFINFITCAPNFNKNLANFAEYMSRMSKQGELMVSFDHLKNRSLGEMK